MNNNDQFLFNDRVVIGNLSAVEQSIKVKGKRNKQFLAPPLDG